MVKSEISSITINTKNKTLFVALKCCFNHVISYDPSSLSPEQRPYFECDDFWAMLEKLIKKYKLQQYAPSPSLEEDFSLFEVLEYFFKTNYEE